jgi:transposase-like protein
VAASETSPGRLSAREREQRAVAMRRGGASYDQIARAIGITRSAACKAVRRVLARIAREASEDAAELRALEQQRLDALLAAVWPRAAKGDLAAVDRALRIAERRARLLGLDAPVKAAFGKLDLVDVHELVFGPNDDGKRFDARADAAAMRAAGLLAPADDD